VQALDLLCRTYIVILICDLENHPDMEVFGAMSDCYEKAGNSEADFDMWLKERIATYPAWCD